MIPIFLATEVAEILRKEFKKLNVLCVLCGNAR